MSGAEEATLLTVVVDTNPYAWGERSAAEAALGDVLQALVPFLNAFMMLHQRNALVVVAAHVREAKYLYSSLNEDSSRLKKYRSEGGFAAAAYIVEKLQKLVQVSPEPAADGAALPAADRHTMLSGALSLALCQINRAIRGHAGLARRILCVSAAPESPAQYIPTMNCIFAAQKIRATIDALVLAQQDSVILQQAAHLTDGAYLRLDATVGPDLLLPYLLTTFLADKASRAVLNLPVSDSVDFRASCFCCRKTIDDGYVCSVCLSIFCKWTPECSTCGTTFTVGRRRKSGVGAASDAASATTGPPTPFTPFTPLLTPRT